MADPTAVVVEDLDPRQGQVAIERRPGTNVFSWYGQQSISQIPQESVGWLVAQGWSITAVSQDATTTPPTYYYTLSKLGLVNWKALQSLINEFTIAYNDSRHINNERYNQVVASWSTMIDSSHDHFDAQVTEQNEQVRTYLNNLDTYSDAVEVLVADNEASMSEAVEAATELLSTANDLTTAHAADYNTRVNQLLTDYTGYRADFRSLLDFLPTEYDEHAGTARAFLTDLGTTELARINETFAASLATQLAQLTDRGLYSSGVASDITARSHRDRDEQIQALYDRLAREKLANQHQLYEQQVALRGRQLDGTDRLYDRQTAMRQAVLAGKDHLHGLKQELLRYRIAQVIGNAQAIVEHKHKAIVELMNSSMARLEGLRGMHESNMKLMAYQLDERNKLLVGLYGIVERREDTGPDFKDLATLATSLGDSAGGWIAP